MTAPPKIKPTRSGVGLDKTSEVFPVHHVASPICLSSFLDPTLCNETIRIEGQVVETDRIESLISDSKGSEWVSEALPISESRQKIEFLIIPNTPTAKNQLQALVKTEKERLSLAWRGADKLPNGKWPKSDTPFHSVSEEKRDDLLRTFKKFNIPQEEIELREISVPPPISKHLKKAQKIQALGDQYIEALKTIEAREIEELAATKRLFDEEDISATDYTRRIKEIRDRYAKEKEFLAGNANRNYRAADDIYDEGEKKKNAESILSPLSLDELKKCLDDNEVGDAALFRKMADGNFLYDPDEKSFYLWNGFCWEKDTKLRRRALLSEISEKYVTAAVLLEEDKHEEKLSEQLISRAKSLKTVRRQNSVLEMAQVGAYGDCGKYGLIFLGDWDNHPGFIPCANGILGIKTGRLTPPSRNHFVKKASKIEFDPSAYSDRFHEFVIEVMGGSQDRANFLRRFFGYAALGNPIEDRFLFLYGAHGRNGKGTLVRCISSVLGDLARTFSPELILLQRNPPSSSMPRPDLIHLKGTRLAIFSEINKGRQIDSATLKNLSGRDIVAARSLFSNDVKNFSPTHTVILQANHKPKAPAEDRALWYRAILVPFELSFVDEPKEDHERKVNRKLEEELLSNPSEILRWLVEGASDYLKNGLAIPDEITRESERYRMENDSIGLFIENHCEKVPELSTPCEKLRESIQSFAKSENLNVPTKSEITGYLEARYRKHKFNHGWHWLGISMNGDG